MNLIYIFLYLTCLNAQSMLDDVNSNNGNVVSISQSINYPTDHNMVILNVYDDSYVLLGGSNYAYNISLIDMRQVDRYEWKLDDSARQSCSAITETISSCNNFIRTFFELSRSSFLLCGTNGLKPMCGEFKYHEPNLKKSINTIGLAPVDANFTSPFIRTEESIITVNVADLSSSEPLLLRRNVIKLWKGIDNEIILRTRRGLGSFEQASFLSMLRYNKHEVLIFFTESPTDLDACGLKRVPRVARICDNDSGGRFAYSTEWSSYVKAPLECAIEEVDADTFYYNDFTGLTDTMESIYGTFRSHLAGVGASAVCKYEKRRISEVLDSGFRNESGNGCARAMDDDELAHLRINPLVRKKISAQPIFRYHGTDRFMSVVANENIYDLYNRTYDMLYIATNIGNILKVAIPHSKKDLPRLVSTVKLFENFTSSTKINKMLVIDVNEEPHLVVITDNAIRRIPLVTCTSHTCAECLSSSDPQCAWHDGIGCVNINKKLNFKNVELIQDSGKCPMLNDHREVILPPLHEEKKKEPTCLCEQTTHKPCTTEVIQKETISSHVDPIALIISFIMGIIVTILVITIKQRQKIDCKPHKEMPKKQTSISIPRAKPIDAFSDDIFTTSTISSPNPRLNSLSMHSSIRTYC